MFLVYCPYSVLFLKINLTYLYSVFHGVWSRRPAQPKCLSLCERARARPRLVLSKARQEVWHVTPTQNCMYSLNDKVPSTASLVCRNIFKLHVYIESESDVLAKYVNTVNLIPVVGVSQVKQTIYRQCSLGGGVEKV